MTKIRAKMDSLFVLLVFATGTIGLNGAVKGTVNMPTLKPGSDNPFDIPCATVEYMTNSSFPNWIKIWRLNQSETFDASRITLINDNQTLRLQTPEPSDSGNYECCLHAYAYEDFLCFMTQVIISGDAVNNTDDSSANTTTAVADPPSWNVDLMDGDTLNAQEDNSYFVKVFDVNVTDIKCEKDGNTTSVIKAGNAFPPELFSDVLIPKFNATIHEGVYTCNGTAKNGNETETIQVSFDVIESIDSNLHTQSIDPALAKKYMNNAASIIFTPLLIAAILIVTL